jgi:Fur family transcriptional regulator, ferric uptake regulator
MTAAATRPRPGSRAEVRAEPEARLREYLRARKLRMTPERQWVLQGVLSRRGHFHAEELLAFLHRRQMPVSRATLYRTLEHLTASGLVKKHRFGADHALFEPSFGRHHHDHMVCNRCGQVLEFVNEDIERLQDKVCELHGFTPSNHVMQIFGLCARCHAKEKAPSPRPDAG